MAMHDYWNAVARAKQAYWSFSRRGITEGNFHFLNINGNDIGFVWVDERTGYVVELKDNGTFKSVALNLNELPIKEKNKTSAST